MKYYPAQRHWTKKIKPHLHNPHLKQILVTDMNWFIEGECGYEFKQWMYPTDTETEYPEFLEKYRGKCPRYMLYTRTKACHWLVNFNLKLINLAEPDHLWHIVTSDHHSTVFDGKDTIFDLNFMALGTSADECYHLANELHLDPGEFIPTGPPTIEE